MNSQMTSQNLVKIEIGIVGVILLYYFGVDAPPNIVSMINLLSYPCLGFLVVLRWKRVLYAATQEIPLLLLHLLAFLSILWSAAPDTTENEIKALCRVALFGVYLAARFSLKEQMKLVAVVLGISVVASLVAAVAVPSYGIHGSGAWTEPWKGIFTFKNLFAYMMATASLLFLLDLLNRETHKTRSALLLLLSFMLLIASQGRTALAAFATVSITIPAYWFLKQHYKLRVLFFVTAIFLSSVIVIALVSNLEFVVVDLLGKNLELNGRFPIWNLMLEKAWERPWLGYGFSGFWTSDASDSIFNLSWAGLARAAGVRFNSHNGYLELFLQLGITGLILFALSLLSLVSKTIYLLIRVKSSELFWVLQTVALMILLNVADSIGILAVNSQWSLYISFSISVAMQYSRVRASRAARPKQVLHFT